MNSSRTSASAVVIGGGVIGLFTAWRLLDAGFSVTVLERGQIGRSASWAGGGIISPLPPWQAPEAVWQLAAEGIRDYPGIAATLHEATGIDPEWTPSGMWVIDPPDVDVAIAWAQQTGMPVVQSHRAVADQPRPGLFLPWVAQVRSPRLLKALTAYLKLRGACLIEQAAVSSFEQHGGALQSVTTATGERYAADAYVMCAGAWTGQLGAAMRASLPVSPVRGQMILLQGEPSPDAPIILSGESYLIPRRDGRMVVGSTLETVGFDEGLTAVAQESLLEFAHRTLPASRAMPVINHWAGLRPAAPQGVPLIQALPDCRRAFVNAGHFRNGITLASASARRLFEQVTSSPD